MKLEIKLISSPKLIECEPILMNLAWENTSKEEIKIGASNQPDRSKAIKIWINGEPKIIVHQVKGYLKPSAPSILKPGERIEKNINLRMFNLDSGFYVVKAIADFSVFPPDYFHGIVESNTIEFKIEPPQGIDLQAYLAAEKLPTHDFDKKITIKDITCFHLLDSRFILSAYPTSIYAGWSFTSGKDCCNRAFGLEDLKRANLENLPEPARKRVKETYEGMPGWDLKQIEKLTAFINARPEFSLADKFRYAIAFYRADRKEYKEAIAILEELINNKSTEENLKNNCIKFLNAIKEKQTENSK